MGKPSSSAPLDSSVARQLAQLVDSYGLDQLRTGSRLEGMLKDVCPEKKREIRLIVMALREKVATRMAAELNSTPDDTLVAQGANLLREECGLSESASRWAVEVWHYALSTGRGDTIALPQDRLLDSTPVSEADPAQAAAPATPGAQPTQTEQVAFHAVSTSVPSNAAAPWGWALLGGFLVLAAFAGGWFALGPPQDRTIPTSGPGSPGFGRPESESPHLQRAMATQPGGPASASDPDAPVPNPSARAGAGLGARGPGARQPALVPPPFPPPHLLAQMVGKQSRVMSRIEGVLTDDDGNAYILLRLSPVVPIFAPEMVDSYGGEEAFKTDTVGKFLHVYGQLEYADERDKEIVPNATYDVMVTQPKQVLYLDGRPPPPVHQTPIPE